MDQKHEQTKNRHVATNNGLSADSMKETMHIEQHKKNNTHVATNGGQSAKTNKKPCTWHQKHTKQQKNTHI